MNNMRLKALVRELTALPMETEWVEFKHNKAIPDDIAIKDIKGTLPLFRLFSAMPGLPRTVFDDIPHRVTQRQIKG